MKRSAPELLGRPSPYHASVTLFEATDVLQEPSLRTTRSKRAKLENGGLASKMVDADEEDAATSKGTAVVNTVKTTVRVKTVRARKPSETQKASRSTPPSEKSPKKQKPIPQSLDKPHPAPPKWRETYDTIKDMRSRTVAPVDTMGCDVAQLKEIEPRNKRFTTLISLMLSSQTKDEVTDAAVKKLRDAMGGTLSLEAILNADESTISGAICKVGFWRRKTQYIKQAAEALRDRFDSDVPKTVDELCSLNGVGPKMAFLTLQAAWKLNLGIGVDVHVHRITNRLGWHKPSTKDPEATRLNLQSWLPLDLHPEINHLLVGFGQTICTPVAPKCDQCDLGTMGLCPSARKVVKSKTRKTVKTTETASGPKVEIALEAENEMFIPESAAAVISSENAGSPLTEYEED